ncbi:MAG: helix-turn-helix domain-containing protein, partial [Pedobacter sp.]|nr:helix-turn-helix domain-containing protein [Pedobacter sp.]
IPERSLRRQLSQQGHSFRALLDEVKQQKAEALLQDRRLSVEAIAQQLGYAESAAFIHAFQRWTGSTPAAFRNRQH